MPTRPPKRCTQCPRIATRNGRCDNHQRKAWANKSANTQALTPSQRQALRRQALRADPTCAVCGQTNTAELELDHIIEISDGGNAYDPQNTWLLCKPCHRAKTAHAREQRTKRRRDDAQR